MTFPISRFLNQTVTYQAFQSVNNRDDPTYSATMTVPARIVEVDREHYGKDEDVRQSRTKVLLAFQPSLRSLIAGREVIQVDSMVTVGGSVVGWRAVLR